MDGDAAATKSRAYRGVRLKQKATSPGITKKAHLTDTVTALYAAFVRTEVVRVESHELISKQLHK